MQRTIITLAILAAATLPSCSEGAVDAANSGDERSGGATTVFDATSNAFSFPAPNLDAAEFQLHIEGDVAFEASFVTPPATINGGLGPVYNNVSCISCHGRDGRGRPPEPGESPASMLFRISIPGASAHGGPLTVPGFGGQLQSRATYGVAAEGEVAISYTDMPYRFDDGTEYRLRIPRYSIDRTYIGPPADLLLSPRVAPPVFGLGLLEAVDEATVLAMADEGDRDGDGISGRPNYVRDAVTAHTTLGRFGWKASAPNLIQQAAGAYNEDMGVTSPLFPEESCNGQPQYRSGSDTPEISDATLRAVAHYTATLGVPARRNINHTVVRRGEKIFLNAGCAGCHMPTLRTGSLSPVPALRNQTIHPYSDLLLHDMGDDLADGRPDYLASGREWRTPPLWGIGLTRIVNGHTYFLHDGRARNLPEAIMWHGGEGTRARDYVRRLSADDRQALITFLESL